MRVVCVSKAATVSYGGGFFKFRGGEANMLADKARPEANLLSAFALAIVGALAAGLPMALVIIWACS
jgi:hypothetical protein